MTASEGVATDAVLRRALTRGAVSLDPGFQGLPDTAHGGSVLALFDAAAEGHGPRRLQGTYHRRVPLATPLQLAVDKSPSATRLRLTDGPTLLVDGVVEASNRDGGPASLPKAPVPSAAATPLPISRTCFACGVDNRLGLRAGLLLGDEVVVTRWVPREAFRGAGGALAPVAITTLLDEAAFWLGAAASGEAGMTTTLQVELHGAVPFGEAVTIAGARATVVPRADDPRYWDTDVGAWDDGGRLVARARITFVAVRGTARKLVSGLLAMNARDTLARVFPAYVR